MMSEREREKDLKGWVYGTSLLSGLIGIVILISSGLNGWIFVGILFIMYPLVVAILSTMFGVAKTGEDILGGLTK